MTPFLRILFLSFFITVTFSAFAQPPIKDTLRAGKTIIILGADRYNFQQVDSTTQVASLGGNAKVQQEKTLFYADSISLNQKDNILEAFGHVHINDNDSINTYSDYLKYVGKEKKAYLNKNVKLTDGKGVLTTNELVYDTQLKIGTYYKGGKVVNGKTIVTSTEGYYYGETKDVYFKKNVALKDPDFNLTTDTLLYNTTTSIATFVAPTKIINGKRTVTTKDGYYDTKNKKAFLGTRPFIDDSTYTFTADRAAIDDASGLSEYEGSAVYRSKDKLGYDLIADNIKLNKKTNSFLATRKPILLIKQEQDTLYVSADTLFSARLSDLMRSKEIPQVRVSENDKTADTDIGTVDTSGALKKNIPTIGRSDTASFAPKKNIGASLAIGNSEMVTDSVAAPIKQKRVVATDKANDTLAKKALADIEKDSTGNRYFEAYYHVRIFSDSLQAVCDSMFYSARDSVFRMFKEPVAWAQGNQIFGDTMYLFVQNKKPERLYVFENALTIQRLSDKYFNQVKGNTINGYFVNGNIDHLRAKGNAETVYYGVDETDGKFLAVNKATCDVIDMYFLQKTDGSKPQRIVMRNNLEGTAYPMRQVNHEELRLRKFKWLENLRPKSKFDILAN